MREELLQVRMNRVQFREANVLDLLDNMVPIDIVHTLPTRDAAQQSSLAFRPGKGITVVEIVGHDEP